MLGNAIAACPDALWHVRLWDDAELPESAAFWYVVYHTLFWLDLYLSGAVEGFVPPAPFTSTSWTRRGCCPSNHIPGTSCRPISSTAAEVPGDDRCADGRAGFSPLSLPWGEVSFAGLLLDNMRHVQEHAAQLNLILGQKAGWSPRWVAQAKS